MGFKKIERGRSGPLLAEDYVKARCYGRTFELLFSEDLWIDIGQPDRVCFYVGTGADKGRIAIDGDASGFKCQPSAPRSRMRRINIVRSKLGLEPFGSRILEHEVVDGRLIIFMGKRRKRKAATAPSAEQASASPEMKEAA